MIEHSGGRAGPHEVGWLRAGYKRDEVEPLRQQLLRQNDVGKVQRAMRKLGIRVSRTIIQAVKEYNFDSQGVGFVYENYAAWRRLATGKGTIGDACYLIHEMAEVQELQQIKRQTGFDFMGRNFKRLSNIECLRWAGDFRRNYLLSHSKALEAEYEFVAEQVNEVTNGRAKLSKLQAAAIDPTRRISDTREETEAWQYMFVDGVRMKAHHHFDAWRKRANELIPLSKRAQRRLGYYSPKITLQKLIRHVKMIQIK